MAKPIHILIDTNTNLLELAAELNRLLDIELLRSLAAPQFYEFRAMTLTFSLRELDTAQKNALDHADYRYLIAINGIFGSEEQRTKWTHDWSYSIMQTLKAEQKYRLKRVDSVFSQSTITEDV